MNLVVGSQRRRARCSRAAGRFGGFLSGLISGHRGCIRSDAVRYMSASASSCFVALDKAFRTKWTADATVIWTARHVDRWTAKLAQLTGQPEPVPVPALRTLRNALEHLDEAVFDEDEDDGYATVPPTATRKKFALADLPNGRLLVGTEAVAKFYGLIEVDALRELASTLTARLDGLMDELASDYYAQQIIDERRGK